MAPSTVEQPSELGRMLSMNSGISAARQESTSLKLDKIGAGTCGVILTKAGTDTVFKMAKHDTDALTGDVFNDFKMHHAVYTAMNSVKNDVDFPRVPFLQAFIPKARKDWWKEHTDLCAAARDNNIETPCNTLCSERIVPLPVAIRSRLIERFCPERLRGRAHEDSANKDCLVRVYLGSRKEPDGPRKMFFSLRNYKLHLNQMLELGMDIKPLAHVMAGALAVMHWKARIDAKDVEFALGSSPIRTPPKLVLTAEHLDQITETTYVGLNAPTLLNWTQRVVDLWLLDFNLCSTITMDDVGVAMAAKAWSINDPYYPKPLQDDAVDRELWNAFVSRYIEVSDQILQPTPTLAELPRKFIASIIRIQQERKGNNM